MANSEPPTNRLDAGIEGALPAASLGVAWQSTALAGPLTEDRLKAFEQAIGAELPADYRAFLLAHNGGIPVRRDLPMTFHPDYDDMSTECECFLPLHDQPWVDTYEDRLMQPLQQVHQMWKAEQQEANVEYVEGEREEPLPDPDDYLPIARDPGGNLFCVAIAGAERGAVFFSDHETMGLHRVADSVTAFCQQLGESAEE